MLGKREFQMCSYTVKFDSGFASNPFGGYCTIAACTPNHMVMKLNIGDWILGHATVEEGQGLIDAMRISEKLDFDEYYHDRRFAAKKPQAKVTWKEKCGDNIYHRLRDRWIQDQPAIHGPSDKKKDLEHPTVFVSDHFFYFGNETIEIPNKFTDLIWARQGCKKSHAPVTIRAFIEWLEQKYRKGIHGDPRHKDRGQEAFEYQIRACK